VTENLGIKYTCQKCRKRRTTTRTRSIYTKDYTGPCGDSFCYASCDSSSCRPVEVVVCDPCAALMAKPTEKKA